MKTENQTPQSSAKKAPPARRFPQMLQASVGGRTLGAALFVAGTFAATVAVPCSLHPDSIRYAACRVFLKSSALRERLLPLSHRMRLSGKKGPRSRRFCLELPIRCFALAEGQAFLAFSVSAEGVTLERVWLLPAGAPAPRRPDLRLRWGTE